MCKSGDWLIYLSHELTWAEIIPLPDPNSAKIQFLNYFD